MNDDLFAPGSKVIARSAEAGVFAGTLQSRNGTEVVLTDARRLWYWVGAATLSELSVSGVANPGRCKFPVAVPFVALPNVCELLPLSPGAEASIAGVPVWTGR